MRRLVDDGYRVVMAFEQRAEAERAGYVLRRVTGHVAHGGEMRPDRASPSSPCRSGATSCCPTSGWPC